MATAVRDPSGGLSDKATTVFTEEPEQMAPESSLHPVYGTLHKWAAMIVGPGELEPKASPGVPSDIPSPLSAARLSATRYRAFRLASVAEDLADDHAFAGLG